MQCADCTSPVWGAQFTVVANVTASRMLVCCMLVCCMLVCCMLVCCVVGVLCGGVLYCRCPLEHMSVMCGET